MIPSTLSPGLTNYLLDNFNLNLLWHIAGILCLISALGFYASASDRNGNLLLLKMPYSPPKTFSKKGGVT
jgi:hypothetical protein